MMSLLSFNPDAADWTAAPDNHVTTRVKAYIPDDCLCPTEMSTLSGYRKDHQEAVRYWSDHVWAVWRAMDSEQGWAAAVELVSEHRINKEPIEMIIYDWAAESFSALEVVNYIEEAER